MTWMNQNHCTNQKSHIVHVPVHRVHVHECLNQVNQQEQNKPLDASMVWGAEGKK